MLCLGWYCVERAQGGLLQLIGNQRPGQAGKSAKSGAKCGCHFLAVSRVAESATQSQLFPSSTAPTRPPPTPFPHSFFSPCIIPCHFPLSWTALGPYQPLCRTLLCGVTRATDPLSQRGGAVMTEALHYPAPAEPPYSVHGSLHQPAQVAHLQLLLTPLCWY